ncbi:MAG TPA: hypothetical protein VIJ11_02140 [Galbitalea sp.]
MRNHLATVHQRFGVHSQAELIGAVRGYPEKRIGSGLVPVQLA